MNRQRRVLYFVLGVVLVGLNIVIGLVPSTSAATKGGLFSNGQGQYACLCGEGGNCQPCGIVQ